MKVIYSPMQQIKTDFVVVGAGVAGLRAALELTHAGDVLVITKDSLRESSSEYAQGGIAAALNDDDEVACTNSTPSVRATVCATLPAVRTLVEEAPAAIEELIEWGAAFDREGAKLLFAREGAHSRNRVLHAHGDSTGREIVRTLRERAAAFSNIRFQSFEADHRPSDERRRGRGSSGIRRGDTIHCDDPRARRAASHWRIRAGL